MIRSLRYLCNTRPYLVYSVAIVSVLMGKWKKSHLTTFMRIIRYVKGLISCRFLFLTINKGKNCKLLNYDDLNRHGDKDDKESTTRYIFMYEETLIYWCSKKKLVVALSSCNVEYIAASACVCVCKAPWLVNLRKDLCR